MILLVFHILKGECPAQHLFLAAVGPSGHAAAELAEEGETVVRLGLYDVQLVALDV